MALSGDGGDELFAGGPPAYGRAKPPIGCRSWRGCSGKTRRVITWHSSRLEAVPGSSFWAHMSRIGPFFGRRCGSAFTIQSWMQYADSVTYLSDDILTKVDRASMAIGLEARDHRIVEFTWRSRSVSRSAPATANGCCAKCSTSMCRNGRRRACHFPLRSWLRGSLRDWAADLLDPAAMTQAAISTRRRSRRNGRRIKW